MLLIQRRYLNTKNMKLLVLLTVYGLSNRFMWRKFKTNEENNQILPFADEIVTNKSFFSLENTFVLENRKCVLLKVKQLWCRMGTKDAAV